MDEVSIPPGTCKQLCLECAVYEVLCHRIFNQNLADFIVWIREASAFYRHECSYMYNEILCCRCIEYR